MPTALSHLSGHLARAAFVAVLGIAMPGLAQETTAQATGPAPAWRIVPVGESSLSVTDNAFGTSDKDADAYLRLAPGVGVTGQTARLNFNLDYTANYVKYAENEELDGFLHDLRHLGALEVWDDHLFLETRATVGQRLISTGGALRATDTENSENLATVASYALGPVLRNRFGGFAASELRYSFGQVYYDEDVVADSNSHSLSADLTSGTDFTRLRWGLGLGATWTDSFDEASAAQERDTERRTAELSLGYAVIPSVFLLSGGGYEEIEDNTLRSDIDGGFWNAGFEWRLSDASHLRVLYHDRYDENFVSAEAVWRVSPRQTLTLAHNASVETSQSLALGGLGTLGTDEQGALIDNRGLAFGDLIADFPSLDLGPEAGGLGLTNAAFTRQRSELAWVLQGVRNVLSASAFYEDREFDFAGDETAVGGSIRLTHDFSPRLSGSASTRYRYVEFDGIADREDHIYGATLQANYELGARTDLYGSYNFLGRDSDRSRGDTSENVLMIGVRHIFAGL